MAKTKLRNSVQLLIDTIIDAMQEKKAEQILVLDLSEIKGANFDYFVITHGNSLTQVSAIAEEIRRKVKTICQQNPAHAEGFSNAEWILLDYMDVVAHVFQKDVREHYQLENLWADAVMTPIEEDEQAMKTNPKSTRNTASSASERTPKKSVNKSSSTKDATKKTVKKSIKNTVKTDERKSIKSKSQSATKSKSAQSAKTKK